MHLTYQFHDPRLAATAAAARAVNARMEGEGDGGQQGGQQGQGTPNGAQGGQQGSGQGDAAQGAQGGQQSGGEDTVDYWKSRARQHEDRAKANAAAAKELEQLKASQMSEQEKLQKRAEDAERKAADLEARNLRSEVALNKGLSPKLAARLQGSTKEELEKDADELLKDLGQGNGAGGNGGGQRGPDLRQGARGGQPPNDFNATLRGMARQ